MHKKAIIGMLLGVFWISPAFAARTILYYENECCRNITEGEFAILYVEGLKLNEPAQGWTVQSAAAALTTLGHQPEKGWVLSRFLSEAVMSRLLKNSPFYRKPFSVPDFQKSDKLVTISNARSLMPGEENLTQGEFAIFLAEALNLPASSSEWTAETAIRALSSQPNPIRPAKGWRATDVLKEGEMLEALAHTPYRSISIDPQLPISTLRIYSLLFGKFEIATEGLFGIFIVNSLGVQPKDGSRWTMDAALDYISKEFGVQSGYGWNSGAPLCAETFDNALQKIIEKLRLTTDSTGGGGKGNSNPREQNTAQSGNPAIGSSFGNQNEPKGMQSQNRPLQWQPRNEAGAFLNTVRRSGIGPGEKCAIIGIRGLVGLARPESPLCYDCVRPSSPETPSP